MGDEQKADGSLAGETAEELYVVVSDKCNFSCSHCLNSSGPKANRYRLQKGDAEALVAHVNSHPQIKKLHFSGGEPTLHLADIASIQKGIDRPLHYALTTNGWFGENPAWLYSQVKLQEIVVSFDKFHEPFTSSGPVLNLIRSSLKQGVSVSVNWVFESLADLVAAEEFQIPGVSFRPIALVRSGRQMEEPGGEIQVDHQAIHGTCPSLEQSEMKTIFIPERGLTPCCGPLAFDDEARGSFVFSPLGSEKPSPLAETLAAGSFAEQGARAGLDLAQARFRDRCDACCFLHAERFGGRSLQALAEEALTKGRAVALSSTPLGSREHKVLQRFALKHLYAGLPQEVTSPVTMEGLRSRAYSAEQFADFVRFQARVTEKLPSLGLANEFEGARAFAPYAPLVTHSKLHYDEEGRLVAALLCRVLPHPEAVKGPSFHIEFLGVDTEALGWRRLPRLIEEWRQSIASWNGDRWPVTAVVDESNRPAQKLAQRFGLRFAGLRLETKGGHHAS